MNRDNADLEEVRISFSTFSAVCVAPFWDFDGRHADQTIQRHTRRFILSVTPKRLFWPNDRAVLMSLCALLFSAVHAYLCL